MSFVLFVNLQEALLVALLHLAFVYLVLLLFALQLWLMFRLMVKIIPVILELGEDNISDIADRICWKRTAVRKYIKNIKKHGYI